MLGFMSEYPLWGRIIMVLAAAIVAHAIVRLIRASSTWLLSSDLARHISKTRTIVSLSTSILVFTIYFVGAGFALSELGVPLSTYLASASIIGFAVAFGSQGLVQDVVSGLTIVFTGLLDIGDLVEVSGQVGVVESFGMRFTVLRTPLGARTHIPNRSITNVVLYPRGYMRCLVDVGLPDDPVISTKIEDLATVLTDSVTQQFPGIFRASPEIVRGNKTVAGKKYLRIKFRIWPGRGDPLEKVFQREFLQAVKRIDAEYPDWMISVNYEIEQYTPPSPGIGRKR